MSPATADRQKVLVVMPRVLALRLKEAAWQQRTDRNTEIVRILSAYVEDAGIQAP